MHKVRLTLLDNQQYIMSDSNNERLSMIADILLDPTISRCLKHKIERNEPIKDCSISSADRHALYTFSQQDDQTISIHIKEHYVDHRSLQTDIKAQTLLKLIEQLARFKDERIHQVLLTQVQDEFELVNALEASPF